MAWTKGVNFRTSSSPAPRSPARYRRTFAAQSSGGQSHPRITGPRGHGGDALVAECDHRDVVMLGMFAQDSTEDVQHGRVQVPPGTEFPPAELRQPLTQALVRAGGLIEQAVGRQEQFVTAIQAPGALVPVSQLQSEKATGEG